MNRKYYIMREGVKHFYNTSNNTKIAKAHEKFIEDKEDDELSLLIHKDTKSLI